MANPRNHKVLGAATATGPSGETRTNGHVHVTIFIVAKNLDTANDSLVVEVEGSPDGSRWDNIGDPGTTESVSASDFTEDPDNAGDYVATLTYTGMFFEFLRLRVTTFSDAANGDLEVDGYVMAAGNAGAGVRGNPLKP